MTLTGHLNRAFAKQSARQRQRPTSLLIAVMPDGSEREVKRVLNAGRTVYKCGDMSSSVLGDLVGSMGAQLKRR